MASLAFELADRLGYRSEAAFARAFKRVIGISPGTVKHAEAPHLTQADPVASASAV